MSEQRHNEALERYKRTLHDFDDDAVCKRCGFDGAEWYHWRHSTHEGVASESLIPICRAAHDK
jgi:predicted alpha/beta-fold hydrolase